MGDGLDKKKNKKFGVNEVSINWVLYVLLSCFSALILWIFIEASRGGDNYIDFIPLAGSLLIALMAIFTLKISWGAQQEERANNIKLIEEERDAANNKILTEEIESFFFLMYQQIWRLVKFTNNLRIEELNNLDSNYLSLFSPSEFKSIKYPQESLDKHFKALHAWLKGESESNPSSLHYMKLMEVIDFISMANHYLDRSLPVLNRLWHQNLYLKDESSDEDLNLIDHFNEHIHAYEAVSLTIDAANLRVESLYLLIEYYKVMKERVERVSYQLIGKREWVFIPELTDNEIVQAEIVAANIELKRPNLDVFLRFS